jgi:hypothetical protein
MKVCNCNSTFFYVFRVYSKISKIGEYEGLPYVSICFGFSKWKHIPTYFNLFPDFHSQ